MAVGEFISMLVGADEANVWGHVGLAERDLPYVLVLTRDYSPWTGIGKGGAPQRKLWFRFWFDHRVGQLPDLWIHRPVDLVLQRASFTPPQTRRGRPNINALVRVVELPVTGDFLDAPPPQLPGWVVQKVEAWFASHWRS